MFNNGQLRVLIIQPVLKGLNLYTPQAEDLLVGTCAHESHGGDYLAQIKGPACGIYQMETATHDDLWRNYLAHNPELVEDLFRVCNFPVNFMPASSTMYYHLYYATAMARIFYRRISAAIPLDLAGQAAYYKRYFNTPLGAATAAQYIKDYTAFIGIR